jgi:HNH endonuclease
MKDYGGWHGGASKVMPDIDRVLGNLTRGECWEWTKYVGKKGYAVTPVGSRRDGTYRVVGVHRFVYEQIVGPIPDGYQIDHLCKNRKCAKPDHLEAVTPVENIRRSDVNAWRRAKTHCPQRHSYAEHGRVRRGCRECMLCASTVHGKRNREKQK